MRLFRQQSRASYMLALCLRTVLISSPGTWDWMRRHALVVMHRRTLYENVDSPKIKVPFYTTDIDILRVVSSYIVSIYIDESLHPYYLPWIYCNVSNTHCTMVLWQKCGIFTLNFITGVKVYNYSKYVWLSYSMCTFILNVIRLFFTQICYLKTYSYIFTMVL